MTCADGTTLYNYDAFGNLRHITLPSGTAIDYIIDGQNRRIGKKVNGTLVESFFYRNQLQPTAWLDGTGAVKATFVYGLHANVPEYIVQGGTTYRLITDQVGSVRLVENTSTGALAERIDYDEFGNVLNDTAPGTQPFGFAGGLRDLDAGLTRFGARDYNPVTGSWTTTDPLKFGGGLANLYTYAGADPFNKVDVDGLLTVYVWNYQESSRSWGHTSIQLEDGTYISWWPSDQHGGSSSSFSFYHAPAYPDQTFDDDITLEARAPDNAIHISGLDEAAIGRWWAEFRSTHDWKTLSQNCSTTVAEGLKAGGASNHASWWSSHNLVWTPQAAQEFAQSILRDFSRKKDHR